MNTFKIFSFILLCTTLFVSCKKEEKFTRPEMNEQEILAAKSIQGEWTEFVPFNPDKPKSFILNENGEASSINIINNEYKNWWVGHHYLYVISKNADNKNDTLILTMKAISDNTIVLEQNSQEYTYKRVSK
ncbi:MAG: lipocalin family protein [Flavobacterium sp.]